MFTQRSLGLRNAKILKLVPKTVSEFISGLLFQVFSKKHAETWHLVILEKKTTSALSESNDLAF
jgi:hypothetical protein